MMTQRQADILSILDTAGQKYEKELCSHVLGKTLHRLTWVDRFRGRKHGNGKLGMMLGITDEGRAALEDWKTRILPVIQTNRRLRADIAHSLALIHKNKSRL